MSLNVYYTARCSVCRHCFDSADKSTFLTGFFIASRFEHCPGCARTLYRHSDDQVVVTKIVREWVKVPRSLTKPSTWLFGGHWNEISREVIRGQYEVEEP
jgi:hypothetical protein